MARQSPSPRRAVVLRAGPPQRRGRFVDLGALVVGVLLLVLAVALVDVLPEQERIVPQFRVAVQEMEGAEYGTERLEVPAGGEAAAAYEVQDDNVFRFTVSIEVQDDQPSSLPDWFELELLRPDGTAVGEPRVFQTRPAQQKNQSQLVDSADPTQPFFSDLSRAQFEFDVVERPKDRVVDAVDEDETAQEAGARLLPDLTLPTTGTWTVRVRLTEAGGCPDPDPGTAFQAAVCQRDLQPSGMDPGNGIAITLVKYRYYTAAVEDL